MGKFMCECGHVISDTALPCKELNYLVDSSTLWDNPEKLTLDNEESLPELWECPKCLGLTRFENSAYRTCYYKRIDEIEVTADE